MISHIGDLLAMSLARYIRVLPDGLELSKGVVTSQISAEIFSLGPARTLYEDRKPICRSLDGIRSLKNKRPCAGCDKRVRCTPQIRLDILHRGRILRLLLAYTSSRNLLLYLDSLRARDIEIKGSSVKLRVLNRGRWGELRFVFLPKKNSG